MLVLNRNLSKTYLDRDSSQNPNRYANKDGAQIKKSMPPDKLVKIPEYLISNTRYITVDINPTEHKRKKILLDIKYPKKENLT